MGQPVTGKCAAVGARPHKLLPSRCFQQVMRRDATVALCWARACLLSQVWWGRFFFARMEQLLVAAMAQHAQFYTDHAKCSTKIGSSAPRVNRLKLAKPLDIVEDMLSPLHFGCHELHICDDPGHFWLEPQNATDCP